MKFILTYQFTHKIKYLTLSVLFFLSLSLSSQIVVDSPCNVGSQPNWPLDGTCYAANTNGMSPLFNTGTCNSSGRDDAWATFTGDGNNLTISYIPSADDAIIHVFSATAPCSVTEQGCSDVGGNGVTETVTLAPSVLGQVYFVRIQRSGSNSSMSGCLSITSVPPSGGSGGNNCAGADRIACGDPILVGETTIGNTNTATNWNCYTPITTPGEDHYYVVQWPDAVSGGAIRLNFTNVVDANDPYLEVLSLGNTCTPNTCVDGAQLTVATGLFPAAVNFYEYTVPAGVVDYYFVVDAQIDGITSYDLQVTCFATGITSDLVNSCAPIPITAPANQGYYQTWNGAIPPVTQDPTLLTGTYTICENIYLLNAGWEWLKYFNVTLGACWINTTNYIPNGANTGFHSLCGSSTGSWTTTFAAGVISWTFVHPNNAPCPAGAGSWGDGNQLANNYTCALYTFCYNAQVDPACSALTGFQNGIVAIDDGIGGGGGSGISPSNVTLGTTSPTLNNLPITLISFNAEAVLKEGKYGVVLNWKTASEINNDYFTIEHSIDGENYKELFQMKGAGTSTDINNYVAVDENPKSGINYYRLKQTDFNGAFEYFNIVPVDVSNFEDVSVYPSPAQSELTIDFISKRNNSDYVIKIYDIRGVLVYSKEMKSVKGRNQTKIDTKYFSIGLYILFIENNNEMHKINFVKK